MQVTGDVVKADVVRSPINHQYPMSDKHTYACSSVSPVIGARSGDGHSAHIPQVAQSIRETLTRTDATKDESGYYTSNARVEL